MEEPERNSLASTSTSSPSSSSATVIEESVLSLSENQSSSSSSATNSGPSTSSSQFHEGDEERQEDEGEEEGGEEDINVETMELIRQRTSLHYRSHYTLPQMRNVPEEEPSMVIREDTWSCVIVILTFWFFVSLTMILGIYGSETIQLSPCSSVLLQPNPFFVQYLKVEKSDGDEVSPMVYELHATPSLNVTKTWSEYHNVSVESDYHQEWLYYLNEGSQMNISYDVPSSSSLFLVITQGNEGMAQWLEDPSYPNNALSWNVINGTGAIIQDITKSSDYFVALGNFNSEDVEVRLNLQVKSFMYDVTGAYYKCNLTQSSCTMKINFPSGNAAVLMSPGPQQNTESQAWYVELTFEPRWISYLFGIGGMTLLMFLAFSFLNKFRFQNEEGTRVQAREMASERAPLLSSKDDDLSSWGSSYDSVSNDGEEPHESLEDGLLEGRPVGDGESSGTSKQLCVICFDAPRECFFLPCGHCAACFTCGTRIAEAAGTCPICRRKMKKVRKIFTV